MKFHVGDRWADTEGREWFVFAHATDGSVQAVNGEPSCLLGIVNFEDGVNPYHEVVLTRLISSERWIPFVEKGPDEPEPNERRSILIRDPLLWHVEGRERICIPHDDSDSGRVRWFESHLDSTIDEMIDDGYTEWKYLLPPEAP